MICRLDRSHLPEMPTSGLYTILCTTLYKQSEYARWLNRAGSGKDVARRRPLARQPLGAASATRVHVAKASEAVSLFATATSQDLGVQAN